MGASEQAPMNLTWPSANGRGKIQQPLADGGAHRPMSNGAGAVVRSGLMTDSPSSASAPAEIDTTVAHASRVYDYFLGGTTNFEVDRAAAQHLADAIGGVDGARGPPEGKRA